MFSVFEVKGVKICSSGKRLVDLMCKVVIETPVICPTKHERNVWKEFELLLAAANIVQTNRAFFFFEWCERFSLTI